MFTLSSSGITSRLNDFLFSPLVSKQYRYTNTAINSEANRNKAIHALTRLIKKPCTSRLRIAVYVSHVSKNQRSVGSTPTVNSNIPVHISERRHSTHSYLNQHQSPTRISIKRVPFIKSSITPLSLCLLSSRSVRNKSAAFFDYICECKADLVAVTKT